MKKFQFAVLVLLVLLVACQSSPSDEQVQTAIAKTEIVKAEMAGPTNTKFPTLEPTATYTKIPTYTPKPTSTKTPKPSPTKVPDPITISGYGDSVVDVNKEFETGIVHIVGNKAGRYFGIHNYDENNSKIDLLVNTTESYDGWQLLDIYVGDHTARFEITAVGEWEITVYPIDPFYFTLIGNIIDVPGSYSGTGDYVLVVNGKPDLAVISGNNGGHYFGVHAYGNSTDLLVNTTDPYSGTVIIDRNTAFIQITAEGDWTIELKD